MFSSNMIFSRVATPDMSNEVPRVDVTSLTANDVLLCGNRFQQEKLTDAYGNLLARVLCQMPVFTTLSKHVPNHIPHEFTRKMSKKSLVLPLPIQFRNESKHEDCLGIMDQYEDEFQDLFRSAFGSVDLLRKYKVPVGGDQLTRVRLQEAKNLRSLSLAPERRLEDLTPVVCELWHMKQDLLEKCYKTFYKQENTPGTLYFYKTLLQRTNVNGNVKSRFQPHMDLLLAVGEALITEQFLEFFGMEDKTSTPAHCLLNSLPQKSQDEKKVVLSQVIQEFMSKYQYGLADTTQEPLGPRKFQVTVHDNKIIVKSVPDDVEEDELFNYSLQLCHWYLQIVEMNDTAKEGDLNRAVLNCKYCIPFFYSHSPLSKYMVESIDYVLKAEHLLSPLQRIRVLEGSFVNTRGGKGKNIESDLCQEHTVCHQKNLIKHLGANKSNQAITRVTCSADAIAEICYNFDASTCIKQKSSRHSNSFSEADQDAIYRTLRRLRPFHYTPGRKCIGFNNIRQKPVQNVQSMKERISHVIGRLTRGQVVQTDDQEEDQGDAYD